MKHIRFQDHENFEEVYKYYTRATEIFLELFNFPKHLARKFINKDKFLIFQHFLENISIINHLEESREADSGLDIYDSNGNKYEVSDLIVPDVITGSQMDKLAYRCLVKLLESDLYKQYSWKITIKQLDMIFKITK